jgi:hypothetical protein
MGKKIPNKVAKEIKDLVYQKADEVNYLARSRTDNGVFFDQLVEMEDVGERLFQYMRKAEIRTYIKDAILNRYSKDKKQEERPQKLEQVIKELLDVDAEQVEFDKSKQITLYKDISNSCFIVIVDGTFLKWETALRKALLYIAAKPFSSRGNVQIKIILTLFARYQKTCDSDIRLLNKSLSICNAFSYIYGEG